MHFIYRNVLTPPYKKVKFQSQTINSLKFLSSNIANVRRRTANTLTINQVLQKSGAMYGLFHMLKIHHTSGNCNANPAAIYRRLP